MFCYPVQYESFEQLVGVAEQGEQSSYYDIDKFNEIAKTRLNDFSILTTNIESLNAKFDELLIHITELKKINFTYSVICLQETMVKRNG